MLNAGAARARGRFRPAELVGAVVAAKAGEALGEMRVQTLPER